MKVAFNGWQIVALVALILATVVALVAMGQTVPTLVAAGVTIASLMGYQIVQSATNNAVAAERLDQVKELANGNLDAMRRELARKDAQHAEEMTRKDEQMAAERAFLQSQLAQAHDKTVALATMLPPQPPEEMV